MPLGLSDGRVRAVRTCCSQAGHLCNPLKVPARRLRQSRRMPRGAPASHSLCHFRANTGRRPRNAAVVMLAGALVYVQSAADDLTMSNGYRPIGPVVRTDQSTLRLGPALKERTTDKTLRLMVGYQW